MKRVFGKVEVAFDGFYLCGALAIGLWLLAQGSAPAALWAGAMALVLAGGDAFHLLPRMAAVVTGQEERYRRAMGYGKAVTSITMTVFYVQLWQISSLLFPQAPASPWTELLWLLAGVRILLCLFPQNRWLDRYPPVSWAVGRNLPFFLMGLLTAWRFFTYGAGTPVSSLWAAILISFACYLPVVLWSNRSPKVGMLMLPKTCAYLWILILCLSL